jgi:2-amino-4-hydroxy-6-hydroxymethyldihydropteridine diphosphokinase
VLTKNKDIWCFSLNEYMNKAYLLTGGNIGNPLENLNIARGNIEQYCGKILQCSDIYKTAAWGVEDQPDFFNQALCIATNQTPEVLMDALLNIESNMGRMRTAKMGPRTIDIDILFFNALIINTLHLQLPHPRLHLRKFVLTPMAQIAPELVHPVFNKTIIALLEECPDTLNVHKIEPNN